MDNERTVVLTERKQPVGETEHPVSCCLDAPLRTGSKHNRADEVGELGLALYQPGSRSEGSHARRRCLEDTARAALETRTGRPVNDVEWAQARTRLLEFVTILRSWQSKAKTPQSELDNVV
jgi:hypothetical protein